MSTVENKQLMEGIFAELAQGNSKPFRDAMAEDFRWTVSGTTEWSRTYDGKEAVLRELMAPLFAQFADQYTNTAERFIAEDDYVVIECRGQVATKAGASYNNRYCYVCRLADGELRELTEYLDTELVRTVLGGPDAST